MEGEVGCARNLAPIPCLFDRTCVVMLPIMPHTIPVGQKGSKTLTAIHEQSIDASDLPPVALHG
jgi:hypothetical protein